MSGTVWVLRGLPRAKGDRSSGKRDCDGHVFEDSKLGSSKDLAKAWLAQPFAVGTYYATEHVRIMRRVCTCSRAPVPTAGKATGKKMDPRGGA